MTIAAALPVNASLILQSGSKGGASGGGDPPETFDYYISPTGSDSNNGLTTATPWAITALNTKRATYAGMRVGLMDGTYDTSAITAYAGGYSPALGVAPGTSGNVTVVQAVNARMAILDDSGSSLARPIIGALESTVDYFTLKNLKITGGRQDSIFITSTSGQGLGISVDGCEIYGAEYDQADITAAIFIAALDSPVITNCYIHDIRNPVSNYSVTSILMYGCRWTRIEYCTFRNIDNAAIQDKYASGTPRYDMQGTEVRNCYFDTVPIALWGFDNKDQTGTPPSAAPYDPYIIENNVFENCGECLGNPGVHVSASPIYVRNNTIFTNSGTTSGFNLHALNSSAIPSFYNNIFYLSGASFGEMQTITLSRDGAAPAEIGVVDYNMYGPSSSSWRYCNALGAPGAGSYTTVGTLANWRTATGAEAASAVDDPEFTLTGSNADRFQLGGSSPALNAGRVGGLSGGATRHMGAWDGVVTKIGCDFAAAA